MKMAAWAAGLIGFLLVALSPFPAQAFSSAAHVFIADRVDPDNPYKIDYWYGSMAPDLSLYVPDPEKWETAFDDTHYNYILLTPYAWSIRQRAFALGWYTHSEAEGSDYFAHIDYPKDSGDGYVTRKASQLAAMASIDPSFAHFAIETAVDLLLKKNDPRLGEKLIKANTYRSLQDRQLLMTVFVWREGVTDGTTLFTSELAFRSIVEKYAVAYALPPPVDRAALSQLGAQLAMELFGIDVTAGEVYALLNTAIVLCRDDYENVIFDAIVDIRSRLEP